MSLILTLLAAALAAALFYVPAVGQAPYAPSLRGALVALLGLSLLAQVVGLVRRGRKGRVSREASPEPQAPPLKAPGAERAEAEAEVIQFLGRLQEKGRLVDFVMDDITPYSNEQVGAAARVVHQGCREVLRSLFDIQPVHPGEEREAVSLSEDYDARAYRLVGNVPERPPYHGVVLHRGWKAVRISLPQLSPEARSGEGREIIAPAEVDVQ
ncbi:MAG: hypothetical protein Kow0092_12280 [Deferrisomatales bacterium]